MILVDSTVWIDHLRAHDERLAQLLMDGQVIVHPFVTGELALGNLKNRDEVLMRMQDLPQAAMATVAEVLGLINVQNLFGLGIGYLDAHLLASVLLVPGSRLWTRDKRLLTAATKLGISVNMTHYI